MGRLRAWGLLAGSIGLTSACGTAPAPPGAIEGSPGAGSAPGTDQDILPNRPASGDTLPDAPEPDAGDMGDDTMGPDDRGDPPAPEAGAPAQAVTYYACLQSQLIGCDYIHVTAQDSEADLCLQLTLDNCDRGSERALAVSTPLGWRLSSGSVSARADDCVPGQFYLRGAPATDASGSISWNLESRAPTELVIDVTLDLSPSPDLETPLPTQVTLETTELGDPLPACPD